MEGAGKGWGSRCLLFWGEKLCSSNEKAEGKLCCLPQPRVQTDASSWDELELERMSLSQWAKPPVPSCFASAGCGSLSFQLIVVMHLLMPHTPVSRLHVWHHLILIANPQGGCHYCLLPSEEAALREAVTQLRAHSSQMDENPAQVNLTPKPMLWTPSSLMPISSRCIDAIIHCARQDARIRYKLSLISSQQPYEGSTVSPTLQIKKMRSREVK